jgi:hypothetical protein
MTDKEELAELAQWLREEAPRQYPSMPTRLLRWADEVEAASLPVDVEGQIYSAWTTHAKFAGWLDKDGVATDSYSAQVSFNNFSAGWKALASRLAAPPSIPEAAILHRMRYHAWPAGDDPETDPADWELFGPGTTCEDGCIDVLIVRADAVAAPQAQPAGVPQQGLPAIKQTPEGGGSAVDGVETDRGGER